MTRPSDRAIAQALYELSDKAFQTKDDEWVFPVLRIITDRATELDATAAPVVVGEDVATSFYAACQRAAAELPYCWEIRICLENGAGTVELVDPDGEVTNMDVDADDRMTAEVNAAIDAALTAALAGD